MAASTGQATAVTTAGTGSLLLVLVILLGLAVLGYGIWRSWRLGWRPKARTLLRPQVLASLLLLAGMLALSTYAVGHWRRKGAMTPQEAQAADMTNMPAPVGLVAVSLAEVERGTVDTTLRYSGTALGFAEQEITPRTQGWITWMPFYAGDRVRKGQLLAKLDTRELQARVDEKAAAARMAEHAAMISREEYRQALATASQARAEIDSKQGILEDSVQQKRRAEAALRQSQNEVTQSRGEVAEAREALAAAGEERQEALADLAAAQTRVPDAEAQVAAAKADETYALAEVQRSERLQAQGVIALAELQKDRAAAQGAHARVSQAEALVRQVREQIRAAESKARKGQAMERAADARIAQLTAKFEGSQTKIDQAQAEIAAAEGLIRHAQADVAAARANAAAMEAASGAARSHVRHSQEGVAEAKASLAATQTVKGYTEVRSLVDGVITQRNISPGVLVAPGQSILKVAQLRPIRIQVNVPEADLGRIRRGSRVRILLKPSVGSANALALVSTVSAVFPAVDPTARTGIVEALLPNADGRILPGQFVTMEITVAERANTLRVPSAAVLSRTGPSPFGQSGEQQSYVWVAEHGAQASATIYYCPMHLEVRSRKPGLCPKCKMDLVPEQVGGKWKARRVEVGIGASDGQFTEITRGLQAGDHVVVTGHQGLHEGDALAPADESTLASAPGGASTAAAPGRGAAPASPRSAVPPPGTAAGKYYCPMHPEVTSDDPNATCAKCNGMKLVPRPGAGG